MANFSAKSKIPAAPAKAKVDPAAGLGLGPVDARIYALATRENGVTGRDIRAATGWASASAKYEVERICRVHGWKAVKLVSSRIEMPKK